MCIVHGHIPNSCLNTTIVPKCNNKNGNVSDTSNYRPVAVATVVSKLLEHFILSNISPFLGTTDNQFGFNTGHSTDQLYIFVDANCFTLCNPWFICACCVFRCIESIGSSTTHEIIWETNSKKGANYYVYMSSDGPQNRDSPFWRYCTVRFTLSESLSRVADASMNIYCVG